MNIIEIRNLSFTPIAREEKVLEHINLEIEQGTINVVLGDSTSGNSILLKTLNSLIPNEIAGRMEGDVIVDGLNTKEHTLVEMATHCGIVLQNPELQVVSLTVGDDLAFGPANLGLSSKEIQERVNFAAEAVRLKGFENRNPGTLSGGELQSLAIGGILAMRPKVIAMLDPVAMLDPLGKSQVYSVIKDLRDKYGLTIVLSEAGMNIETSAEIADRVIVMDGGKIQFDGIPKEVFKHESVASLGVPEVTQLFLKIRKSKPGFKNIEIPYTLKEASAQLREMLKDKKIEVPEKPSQLPDTNERKEPIIKVRNLHHIFKVHPPVHALKGIDIDIYRNEFVALIGQNGGGKTTFAYHLVGLLKASNEDSSVIVDGVDAQKVSTKKLTEHINYVFQNPDNQFFSMTVYDEMTYGPKLNKWAEKDIQQSVNTALQYFGIEEFKDWYVVHLPRDVKTYVAEATIAALNPQILVIDEPTGGLDIAGALKMMQALKKLNESGKTLIIITHDQKIAAANCTRVVVMRKGKILLDGHPKEVYSQYETLAQANIKSPQITQLGQSLHDVGLPNDVLTVDEMYEIIAPYLPSRISQV